MRKKFAAWLFTIYDLIDQLLYIYMGIKSIIAWIFWSLFNGTLVFPRRSDPARSTKFSLEMVYLAFDCTLDLVYKYQKSHH